MSNSSDRMSEFDMPMTQACDTIELLMRAARCLASCGEYPEADRKLEHALNVHRAYLARYIASFPDAKIPEVPDGNR